MSHEHYPIFLNLEGKRCLVVGGGGVAVRKIQALLSCGARIRVIAPELHAELLPLLAGKTLEWSAVRFSNAELSDVTLVIAATPDAAVNEEVSRECSRRNIPVNVVDSAELSTFILPSVLKRSPLQIAISTGGLSPLLARLLRARLEVLVPRSVGGLAALAGEYREKVKSALPDPKDRLLFWEKAIEAPLLRREDLDQALKQAWRKPAGAVYLVGCGPGDPELLTIKALRLMQHADVVVYDRLVSVEILELVRKDARRIFVGKERGCHAMVQEEINELLIDLARKGNRVLRLKGGDPFVFGRGGEELQAVTQAGVSCQVVPGITAALGCAAAAGIPLTHRDYASSVTIVSGHSPGNPLPFGSEQTLVIYMGLAHLLEASRRWRDSGMPFDTPIALIQEGTTPNQKIIVTSLGELPKTLQESQLQPPVLAIVGDVVRLRTHAAPDLLTRAIERIDEVNAHDPNLITFEGKKVPKERLFSGFRTAWLRRLAPDASDEVHLAVRAQHIRRWEIPRDRYPRTCSGYHAWRNELAEFHADRAARILEELGYGAETVARVQALIRKQNLKTDPEAQLVEDVVCLVFLEKELSQFASGQPEDKLERIIRKTWAKMSDRARKQALGLDLEPRDRALLQRALSPDRGK